MSDNSQKIALRTTLIAGFSLGTIFLLAKYHKAIYKNFIRVKNFIFFDFKSSKLKIEICNNPEECRSVLSRIKTHCLNYPVIGFDAEWVTVNGSRRPVALIQLCSDQGLCALIRLSEIERIPQELRDILENPEIIKTGVGPQSDATMLLQDYSIRMNGTFDLRFLAMQTGTKPEGLAKLSKNVLNVELDKDWRVRCSDWEAVKLSDKQIEYAAKDAQVAIDIFKDLYIKIDSAPTNEEILKFTDIYSDITFKNKLTLLDPSGSPSKSLLKSKKQYNTNKLLKRSFSTRSTPLYDNCQLQAPDGQLLCTCQKKKAEWYLSNNLASHVSDDPFTVRLNFEPAGRAVGDVGKYYQAAKENNCVVCGKSENLIRKNVVPREYRKHFPLVMKDHTSHDVLLLCMHCHQMSNISEIKQRQNLGDKCNAPIHEPLPDNIEEEIQQREIQKVARALHFGNAKIPGKRQEELRIKLQELCPDKQITTEFIAELAELPRVVRKNEDFVGHGELVANYYKKNEGLTALERMWRQHFLDTMKPKYLPELWSVDHNTEKLEIRAQEGRVDSVDLVLAGVSSALPKLLQKDVVDNATSDVEQPIVAKIVPHINVQPFTPQNSMDNDFDDSSSDLDFQSVASSRHRGGRMADENFDNDKTLTEDEMYFSDAMTLQSQYETINSGCSSRTDLDDFQSFASSLTEKAFDSDNSDSTLSQPSDLLTDSEDEDTEVDDSMIAAKQ
ncbi:unnamed protein product [Diamesa hyperborea]